MDPLTVLMIEWYYRNFTPRCERPVWATGCLWFYNRLPSDASIDNLPFDFGISADWEFVRVRRPSYVSSCWRLRPSPATEKE